ncbi:right-handed parallel beta-helix repeat-containing protein [Nitrospira sp. M1]
MRNTSTVGLDHRSSIKVNPGTNIQSLVERHPPGTKFVLKKGVHRLQRIVPKNGNSFVGEAGAILSGARELTGFVKKGKYWVVTGQTQQGQVHGKCQKLPNGHESTSCRYPEDLFLDDTVLVQVTSLSDIGKDSWYFDYKNDSIYLADDPVGHRIETSITRHAFEGAAKDVTIRGLIIEKYANPAQHGAIHAKHGQGWIIQDSEVRLNHGIGIRSGERIHVLRCYVHHNGQLGIGGFGDNILIQHNEISHNNTLEFRREWEAGGTKFVKTQHLIVSDNFVHHNRGPGLWTDIDNINTLYERNRVEDNERAGIFHEISYAAIIRDNVVTRNGLGFPVWLWGSGILIAASSDTQVYRNRVENNADGIGAVQQKRGRGKYGPHLVKNLSVHDNVVSMTKGNTGLVQDMNDMSCFTQHNNRFEYNTYHLHGNRKKYFLWMNHFQTFREWQNYGHDKEGKLGRSPHASSTQ